MTNAQEMEEELEYLRWFYNNADFGPAHRDVMRSMDEAYENYTGCKVPEKYRD